MEIKYTRSVTHSMKKIALVMGTIVISLGFIFLMQFSTVHEYIIKSALAFNPNSESYRAWVTNDPPPIINFYFFNWTNAKDCVVYLNCTKFKFEEVGPYSFYEIKDKVNITWHPNNTISFKFAKRYYYVNDDNNLKRLSDRITNVNPVTIVSRIKYFLKLILSNINVLINNNVVC